jgi:hypothetical protein
MPCITCYIRLSPVELDLHCNALRIYARRYRLDIMDLMVSITVRWFSSRKHRDEYDLLIE